MRESKVLNFREDLDEMEENNSIERIWIDFCKQNTKIQYYDPEDKEQFVDGELSFKGH